MFIVFDKQKIYSYLIALSTVVVLFIFAFVITKEPIHVVETSTNIEENNNIVNQNNLLKNSTNIQ